jgi:hypothetical protein
MDFTLPGGWHVTLIDPWVWLGLLLSAAIVVGVALKLFFHRLRKKGESISNGSLRYSARSAIVWATPAARQGAPADGVTRRSVRAFKLGSSDAGWKLRALRLEAYPSTSSTDLVGQFSATYADFDLCCSRG